MSELKSSIIFRISRDGACLQALRHPVYRRRDLVAGICAERENLSSRCKEKTSSKRHCKRESIEVWHGGGTSRSSVEALVMSVERRGSVIGLSHEGNFRLRAVKEVRK